MTIIEVDGGRYEKLNVVAASVQQKKVRHPVLWDEECRTTEAYGVTAWPVAYLIGVDGRVIWEGNPQRVLRRTKPRNKLVSLLQNELKKVKGRTSSSAKDPRLPKSASHPPSQP